MGQQQFNNRCFTAARMAISRLTWLVSPGLPRSCVHGAATRLWHHALIHRSLHRVVCTRLHVHPALVAPSPFPAAVRDKGSVCPRCLRADVGGFRFVVHCDQFEAPLLDRSLTPECFDFQMLHMARSMSRHNFTCSVRVCVYSRRRQPISANKMQLDATRCLPEMQACISAPSLESFRKQSFPA